MKTVIIIGKDSPAKKLIAVGLGDRLSIELQEYPPEDLTEIVLDNQIDTAIYVSETKLAKKDSEIIALIRSVAKSCVLVGKETLAEVDMFVPVEDFTKSSSAVAIKCIREIRAFIETGQIKLQNLTEQQQLVLELHCSCLTEKEAVERASISRRTYHYVLKELQQIFNVATTCELRQLFCRSIISH